MLTGTLSPRRPVAGGQHEVLGARFDRPAPNPHSPGRPMTAAPVPAATPAAAGGPAPTAPRPAASGDPTIIVRNLWKVFGPAEKRLATSTEPIPPNAELRERY